MKGSERLPDDQAEIVFADAFVEYLDRLTEPQREQVLVEIVALCANPVGSHPLSNKSSSGRLAGWNTVDVLNKEHRVVFSSRVVDGVGVIDVLCAGPRRANAVYDLAAALIASGHLTDDEITEIWQALALLEVVSEEVGLDGWDYRPPAAPEGMILAAVNSGLLDDHVARMLSKDEIEAAMAGGWSSGVADPLAALAAAMRRARGGVDPGDLTRLLASRASDRCDAALPRTGSRCVRRMGHPGAHRGKP